MLLSLRFRLLLSIDLASILEMKLQHVPNRPMIFVFVDNRKLGCSLINTLGVINDLDQMYTHQATNPRDLGQILLTITLGGVQTFISVQLHEFL